MSKYKIEKFVVKEKYYEVFIEADSNDGDYMSTTETFNQQEFDNIIDELINLKNNYSGRHQLEKYKNTCDLYIPATECGEYCHTLEKLSVKMYDADGSVYNVVF